MTSTNVSLASAGRTPDPGAEVAASALAVDGLSVEFDTERGPVRVLHEVSFRVERGMTLGLVGESGSGKTVSSLAVMGLLDPRISRITSGSVHVEGVDMRALAAAERREFQGGRISMIFQEARRSLDPVFTVGEQIAESARAHTKMSRKQAWARAVEMLDLVGIPNAARRAHEYPHMFSGGMCQRVMLAAALAPRPSVLLADEPTTALDVTVQAQMLQLLRDLQKEMGLAILFITHDLGVVAEMCDRVAVMYAGQIIEAGDAEQIFDRPRHPYTEGLIRSLPDTAAHKGRLVAIPGSVPPAHRWPVGCHFGPRCDYATPDCHLAPVPLTRQSDGGAVRCLRSDELVLEGVR
ncbi:ABC transporter ATP-binding protein [Rhodococcus sp. NPDC059968]|uniref:ABC transporter ATP-binding protein n=1 Tax=Rhodococcus sp. NPDC059968 TaxID=3347017 RepID=UPI00366ACED1